MGVQLEMTRERASGFTALELVLVLGLIATLTAVVGWGLRDSGTAARADAAALQAAAVIRSARIHAILGRAESRVLVADSPVDPERHRRVFTIVVRDARDPSRWAAVRGELLLPEGIRFLEDANRAGGEMRLTYPCNHPVEEGRGPLWTYYAFTAAGEFRSPGAVFRFGPDPQSGRPDSSGPSGTEGGEPIAGFYVSRIGAVEMITDPEELR